jgi:hypothetical protein
MTRLPSFCMTFDMLGEHLMKLTFLDLERGFKHRYDFEQEGR